MEILNDSKVLSILAPFNDNAIFCAIKEIVRKAAAAVGSLKETEFDIRFNPDALSPGVSHPQGVAVTEQLKKERQLIRDASDFLITIQIPTFIRDCLDHSAAPLDGVTLVEAIHSRGKYSLLLLLLVIN